MYVSHKSLPTSCGNVGRKSASVCFLLSDAAAAASNILHEQTLSILGFLLASIAE